MRFIVEKTERSIRTGLSALCQFIQKNRQGLAAAAVIILFYAVMEAFGITCPILFVTGISCAGCGMSRAWLSLLRLDLAAAFHYHPLFWLPAVCLVLFFFRKRFSKRAQNCMIAAACMLMLFVYAVRLLEPNDGIVVFHPREGIAYRIFTKITSF